MRIATFNLENLGAGPDITPSLADRIRIISLPLRTSTCHSAHAQE